MNSSQIADLITAGSSNPCVATQEKIHELDASDSNVPKFSTSDIAENFFFNNLHQHFLTISANFLGLYVPNFNVFNISAHIHAYSCAI